jgi:hypothetical protein
MQQRTRLTEAVDVLEGRWRVSPNGAQVCGCVGGICASCCFACTWLPGASPCERKRFHSRSCPPAHSPTHARVGAREAPARHELPVTTAHHTD